MANQYIHELNAESFNTFIQEADKPVLVDFWAPWCGPCRMVAPHVDAVAEAMAGKALVGKLNVDDSPTIASSMGVQSIPTLIVFKNGKVVETMVGARGREEIAKALETHMATGA